MPGAPLSALNDKGGDRSSSSINPLRAQRPCPCVGGGRDQSHSGGLPWLVEEVGTYVTSLAREQLVTL